MSTTADNRAAGRGAALARERDAVILAHNYQVPEVQDVADYVGDSLGLSRQAAATDAEAIVFCGVHFMAETAAILSPDKTVLIPDLDAGCSLAASITADQLREWKAQHPGAVVVSYVNTTAEVKAETRLLLHVGQREGRHRGDPGRPGDPVPAGHVPGALARARDRPQAAHLDGRVPRPRRHPARRTSSAGRRTRPTPSSSSTPSAAARASAWRSATSGRTSSRPRGWSTSPRRRRQEPLPRRDRDRDHPPAEQGGSRQALRGRVRDGRSAST